MTDQQNTPNDPIRDHYATRFQERQARRMAKQAAREARYAARAQRIHRDWSFEVRAGEKVYTFTWRWHGQGSAPQVSIQTQEVADEPAETSPDTD